MLATSGTYNFQSIPIELIIREAYENIGITGEFIEPQKLISAQTSLNILLLEWTAKPEIQSWMRDTTYLPLVLNQGQYTLPLYITDIIQANIRTYTRQLNGTAAATGGGNPANAFDGDPTTFCNAGVNGNISYDYGEGITNQITFVGIQSNTTTLYTLVLESSTDNMTWTLLCNISSQTFPTGYIVWFDVPVSISTRAYRIRETAGATLNLQELYFNNNTFDTPLSNVSRYEYLTYPDKTLATRPTVYYVDRQFDGSILNIWPVPDPNYNCLQYSYKILPQDIGNAYLTNTISISSLFYPALMWGLACRLAIKFKPDIIDRLEKNYKEAFESASIENAEKIPTVIRVDYLSGDY